MPIKVHLPQTAIIPCPRCINGQILAINDWVCFQCGYALPEATKEGVEEDSREVTEEAKLLQSRFSRSVEDRGICPKCGLEVCLIEGEVFRPHKDPATEGVFPRPWCDMSGEAIP